jgi:uncharacterized membrane protein (UPF0127 family)
VKWFVLIWAAAAFAGCGSRGAATGGGATNSSASSSATNLVEEVVYHLDHAQTGLPKLKLFVGAQEMQAEVCTTVAQVSTGLMFRDGIGPEDGMLFIFGEARQRSFYMKNVSFDIAVAYIDAEGVISEIVQLKARDATGVPSKSEEIQFVLEAAPDYFKRHALGPGTLVVSDRGPLRQALSKFAQVR